ncbi:unnamed protein product [Psylliodes chrysocephalus]|uniref:Uncharacterized protein n=1 Tax=Psylliodes chrysocephalus TaxID=3402493 RepID=A0A9P0CDI6_9CUCU|nr:unnamed protein product [Psylliodes chrysocephala]
MSNETTKPQKKPKDKKKKYPVASIRWTPNPPIVKEDNIMSSVARERNIWGFLPTYEVQDHPICMNFIMTGEYQRIWLKERDAFQKDTYTKKREILTTDNNFRRKFVQKFFTYKKPTKSSWLEARCRDLSKLSKDEIFMIKMRETRFKVEKVCEKKKNKEKDKDIKNKCTCE